MILSKKMMCNFIVDMEHVSEDMIVETLNAIGAEVESVFHFPKTDYLKIGKLLDIRKHPHDETLTICRVQIDATQYQHIICGAENVKNREALNKYVIVALTGSELPNGKIISSKNIKGVISEGMLCSYEELNPQYQQYLPEKEKKNIIILEDASLFDSQVYKYINMDDVIFDVSIPTNRPDWQGIRFICREIAAYLELRYIDKIENTKLRKFMYSPFKTNNSALGDCAYYDAVYLRNKMIKESPWTLKGILINHEIKPTFDIIDNCILISLFTGNPLMVYDADKIDGELVIRKANDYEEIMGADDNIYTICPDDLIVCDKSKVVAIAGIIVAKAAAVTLSSTAYLIEVANFRKEKIIETANRLGIQTFQSKLFSKNISLYATKLTIDYLYEYLLKDNVPQQISYLKRYINISEHNRAINVSYDMIRDLIGYDTSMSDHRIKLILRSLGFEISNHNTIYVPSYRTDVMIWQDIAEEIVKILNINSFATEPIMANYLLMQDNKKYEMLQELSRKLRSLQISNVHTYNLTNFEDATIFDFFDYGDPMKVINAATSEREYFRNNVISNLLKVLQYNKKHKNKLRAIFELQSLVNNSHNSNLHIGVVLPTKLFQNTYEQSSGIANDLLTVKGLSEIIVNNFGFSCTYETIKDSKWLVSNDALKLVVYNEAIGYIGRIKSSILKKYDLDDSKQPVYALDINLEKLINSLNRMEHQYEPISKLQSIDRDITFRLNKSANFQAFVNAVKNVAEIHDWELIAHFDTSQKVIEAVQPQPVEITPTPTPVVTTDNPNEIVIPVAYNQPEQPQPVVDDAIASSLSDDSDTWSPISYTVRYYIPQTDKTLSSKEINEITDKLISSCQLFGIWVQK